MRNSAKNCSAVRKHDMTPPLCPHFRAFLTLPGVSLKSLKAACYAATLLLIVLAITYIFSSSFV
jgi:hypothetical protein